MRLILWPIALSVLALWSLLAWVGHGLVPVVGGWLTSAPQSLGLELDAAAGSSSAAAINWVVTIGEWVILAVWALGALLIFAAPVVVRRAVRAARNSAGAVRGHHSETRLRPYYPGQKVRPKKMTLVDRLAERLGRRHARTLLNLRPR